MKEYKAKKRNSLRSFFKTSAMTALAISAVSLIPVKLFANKVYAKSKTIVKPHPLAIKRNNKG